MLLGCIFLPFISGTIKKILLTIVVSATLTLSSNAQRVTLHEEFTGENCNSCATINPAFWSLCDGGTNPDVLIHIAYMSPLPSPGTFYMQDQGASDQRIAYYGVSTAPYGMYDGHVPDPSCGSYPGNPSCFIQADINSEAAKPDSFSMAVTNQWNTTYDSVITIVTMTAHNKWIGLVPKLYVALVENVDFGTAPGSNGEKYFEHVVRAMYPSALGTALIDTFQADTTIADTFTNLVPAYVDKSASPFVVAWIQDDATQAIAQAAQGAPLPKIPVDATLTAVTSPGNLVCVPGGTYGIAHTATLVNNGTTTITSATIYYQIDSGSLTPYTWTGTLAATASTAIAMPVATVSVGADVFHTIYDSVTALNGTTDENPSLAAGSTYFFVENSAGSPIPFGTSFENPADTSYYATDYLNDDNTWHLYWSGTATSLAYNGIYAEGAILLDCTSGESNVLLLPEVSLTTPAEESIDFWMAYAQQDSSSNDELEVVYSTDCGTNWTPIWSVSGSAMATMPADASHVAVPTSPSQYAWRGIGLEGVPAGNVMLGFMFRQEGGNSIWIDDIYVHVPTAVQNVANVTGNINLYPNPAKDETTLSFNLSASSEVQVNIVDALGRTIQVVAEGNMNAGSHTYKINTLSLANGIYNIAIHSESGMSTKRLSVIK